MNRRSFFRLVAGAALAPVAAKAGLFDVDVAPTLWGDGIHDDAPALNALFRGDVVHFANPEMARGAGWFGDVLKMPRGVYRCEDVIRVKQRGVMLMGEYSTIIGDHKNGPVIVFEMGEEDAEPMDICDFSFVAAPDSESCAIFVEGPHGTIGQPMTISHCVFKRQKPELYEAA